MRVVKLPAGTYEYDPSSPLGRPGGFGQVFLGRSASGKALAVKKLHVSAADAAHRELRIANELKARSFQHVLHFVDAGQDADTGSYFVIMPRAERSLQDLVDRTGPLPPAKAVEAIHQIVLGLIEVGDLVHRDLKPDNVLLEGGKWKVADFGIARFVEESTASNTLRECLSPFFGAPEQWRLERCTHATDVYALGCIAYCLIKGKPPFVKDPQVEHQGSPVPPLDGVDPRLVTLVNMCLRKVAESRPSLTRVRDLLAEIVAAPIPAKRADSLNALAIAAAHVSGK